MSSGGRIKVIICVGLVAATLAAYEPVRHNGFVDYNDNKYVVENPNVHDGITRQSVIWAFTKSYSYNWHPITWLSHMLDCEIYGLNPLGHHITNLLIHIANSLLLFLLLSRMTGAMWRSGFVAAAQEREITPISYLRARIGYLIAKKIPLFVLSAISSVITFVAQKHGEPVVSLTGWPLHTRVINALSSYFIAL